MTRPPCANNCQAEEPVGPDKIEPWLCHVCGDGSPSERGTTCSLCYQLVCREHLQLIVIESSDYGSQLKPLCSVCATEQTGVAPKPSSAATD